MSQFERSQSQPCTNGSLPVLTDGQHSDGEPQAAPRTIPTTCIETVGGDPATALRLSFQIKVF